jgi:hypothetical protein
MKTRFIGQGGLVAGVALALLTRLATAGDVYVLVKVADMNRTAQYQVMSAAELKELEKTIQNEKKYFENALRLAAKAWREDEMNKGIVFPAGRLSPRAIVGSPERFENQDKAEAQLNRYYEREAKKEDREREKEKNKGTKSKEESEREKKKEAETMQAADLVKAKVAELMSGKAGGAPEGEKKPDAKVEGKDEPKAGEKPQPKDDVKKEAVKAGMNAL